MQAVTALLQQSPGVPMQDYDFHSDKIIQTLEDLLVDFTQKKNEVDAAEVKSVAEHNTLMQILTDNMKRLELDLDKENKKKADATEKIGAKTQDLTTASASLLDDQEYL